VKEAGKKYTALSQICCKTVLKNLHKPKFSLESGTIFDNLYSPRKNSKTMKQTEQNKYNDKV